ncbi:TPR domain-containing protein [Xylariomycetidae sp. FL2044]|nr:TPR domain-containing protein [Xylariomycetidae sp. FL2044]
MASARFALQRSLDSRVRSLHIQHTASAQSRWSHVVRTVCTRRPCNNHTATLSLQQKRKRSNDTKRGASEPEPPMPPGKLMLRALRQSLSFRPIFSAFRGQNLRALFRQSPEELVLAIIILCITGCACVYVVYAYFHYFQSKQFTRFPPHIAKSLRRALYYSNYAPDPKLALKYYRLALEQCAEAGIDPFSDEVIGLKIQIAAWLEKREAHPQAIEVLEALLRDCKRWLEKMQQAVQDGQVDDAGRIVGAAAPQYIAPKAEGESEEPQQEVNLWAKRTSVLGKTVGISVKLGELYADEHVLQSDAAGERLIWAVETVLKELQRRQVEGVRQGEGDWMTPEQIGGALEALGNHYESQSQHYLAAPLYLQALTMSPPTSCHTAVLMNNLAISLAQQPINPPVDTTRPVDGSDESSRQAPTRATLLASAKSWALQAQKTAEKISGEDRTEECDEACAVALCNLGDIAAMTGDIEEAKRRFNECLALSKKMSFEPGIIQAQDGLKRVSSS